MPSSKVMDSGQIAKFIQWDSLKHRNTPVSTYSTILVLDSSNNAKPSMVFLVDMLSHVNQEKIKDDIVIDGIKIPMYIFPI